jgi:hypothetical protein
MTAITIHQPRATLIAAGVKRYETRSWQTKHRGDIAIHAAAAIHPDGRKLLKEAWILTHLFEYFQDTIPDLQPQHVLESLPKGAIVAIARLGQPIRAEKIRHTVSFSDEVLGDWTDGRWAWPLMNVRPMVAPIPCAGQQGIWYTSDAVDQRIKRELRKIGAVVNA